VPISCFEQNGCRGLQWLGDEACAPSILNSIEDKKLGKTPQTIAETITKEPILEQIKTNTENVRSGSEVDEFSDFIVVKLKSNPLIKRFKLVEIPNTSVDVTFDKFTRYVYAVMEYQKNSFQQFIHQNLSYTYCKDFKKIQEKENL
jgi:hypothetical protein